MSNTEEGPGISLGRPSIRVWELDEESTRYDRMKAAPSDSQMHNMWTAWSVVFFLFATFNLVVFLAVLLKKKTRRNPFNQYLLYIMFPDLILTATCAIQCAFLAAAGGYTDPALCKFQSFYLTWACAADSWLNAVVAFEVHRLLKASNRRLRYFPPTNKIVACRAVSVYLLAAFIASWSIVSISWLPHRTNALKGLVCVPVEFSRASTIFFWVVFFPSLIAIPLVYAVYVTCHVLYNGLLPPSGKMREISIFFLRIIIVFVVMWLPGLVVMFAVGGSSPWALYISGIWAHMQGTVSAAVCMIKLDIRLAVKDFVTCRTFQLNREFDKRNNSSTRFDDTSSLHYSSSSWRLSSTRNIAEKIDPSLQAHFSREISAIPEDVESTNNNSTSMNLDTAMKWDEKDEEENPSEDESPQNSRNTAGTEVISTQGREAEAGRSNGTANDEENTFAPSA